MLSLFELFLWLQFDAEFALFAVVAVCWLTFVAVNYAVYDVDC